MFQPSIDEETTTGLLPCTSGNLKMKLMESDANLLLAMEKNASLEKQLKSCKRELAALKETHAKELMTLKDDYEYKILLNKKNTWVQPNLFHYKELA